jgi:hypothetical protein
MLWPLPLLPLALPESAAEEAEVSPPLAPAEVGSAAALGADHKPQRFKTAMRSRSDALRPLAFLIKRAFFRLSFLA